MSDFDETIKKALDALEKYALKIDKLALDTDLLERLRKVHTVVNTLIILHSHIVTYVTVFGKT